MVMLREETCRGSHKLNHLTPFVFLSCRETESRKKYSCFHSACGWELGPGLLAGQVEIPRKQPTGGWSFQRNFSKAGVRAHTCTRIWTAVGQALLTDCASFLDLIIVHNKEFSKYEVSKTELAKHLWQSCSWSSGEYSTHHILRNRDSSAGVWFLLSWQWPSLYSPSPRGSSEKSWAKSWGGRFDHVLQPEEKVPKLYLGRRWRCQQPCRDVYCLYLFVSPPLPPIQVHVGHKPWQGCIHRGGIQATFVD